MKVLFITPAYPMPAHSGGAIATLETLRSIYSRCELHLLTPPPESDRAAHETRMQQLLPGVVIHYYQALERQPTRFEMYLTAAKTVVTGRSYWASIWLNGHLRTAVQRLTAAQSFDAVHCDWLQPAVSLRGLNLPLVLRTLDVHFVGMLDWVESLPSGDKVRKAYWRRQARRFRRFECATLSAAPAVVTLSAEDESILRDEGVLNIVTISPPHEVEPIAPGPSEPEATCTALFIGRLDMLVNREAFFLFADKVWPEVSDECRAGVKIVFAGGFPDEEVRRRASELGFEIHAPLSDAEARRLFAEAGIFLSPVKSGTGIKIKTLEAMAHGKPIVGFPRAFRGIPVEDNKHAFIADSSKDFARLLERLVFDAALRSEVGVMARAFIRVTFDPAVLGARLMDVYSQVHMMSRATASIWERPSR
jgi:glycosyltransferase involved in cell wall biosynthesis